MSGFHDSSTLLVKRISFHSKKPFLGAQNMSHISQISSSFTESVEDPFHGWNFDNSLRGLLFFEGAATRITVPVSPMAF